MADQAHVCGVCRCEDCLREPQAEAAQAHRAIHGVLALLDERRRRLFLGLLAGQRGHGGVTCLARITGTSRTTIRRGQLEIEGPDARATGRVRRPGGGRKPVEKKRPPS